MNSRGQSFLGTFALVFAAMAALFVFDTFLERLQLSESHAEAQRDYSEGQNLLKRSDSLGAMEHFREALALERQNPDYRIALAGAMLAAGKLADAEAVVNTLLERDPRNGSGNLTMARILAEQGRLADAGSYYHRALYGRWPADAARQRLQVRLELIDFLAKQDDKQDLLAELLPLEVETLDLPMREHIARLYLTAGSPARSADMFRGILREHPTDAGAQAGLGAAEFARGNYRVARAHFQAALRLKPSDAGLSRQLNAANEVLALDPTLRGLSSHERYERSLDLLDRAVASANQCAASSVALPPGQRRPRADQENDAAEANLQRAEQIWQSYKRDCKQPLTDADQPLDLVLTKAAQ